MKKPSINSIFFLSVFIKSYIFVTLDQHRTIYVLRKEIALISSKFFPVGSIDRKIYSKASRKRSQAAYLDGRVILLGKRQRAGGRGKRERER